jgi:hypothetical protein
VDNGYIQNEIIKRPDYFNIFRSILILFLSIFLFLMFYYMQPSSIIYFIFACLFILFAPVAVIGLYISMLTNTIEAIMIDIDGVRFRFRNDEKKIGWSGVKRIEIVRDGVQDKEYDVFSNLFITKMRCFKLEHSIGKAVNVAYHNGTGQQLAIRTINPVPKKGGATTNERLIIKTKHSKLFRRDRILVVLTILSVIYVLLGVVVSSTGMIIFGMFGFTLLFILLAINRSRIVNIYRKIRANQYKP